MDGYKFKIDERVVSMCEVRGKVIKRCPNPTDPIYTVVASNGDVSNFWERELDRDPTYYVDRNRKLESLL